MTKNGQQQIDYALATLAVEGDIPSEYAVQLCEQVANGSLTADEAVSEILHKHGLKKVHIKE